MGLPVLLSVLAEDRDDLELLKGALEVLQLSVALPGGATPQQLQDSQEVGVLYKQVNASFLGLLEAFGAPANGSFVSFRVVDMQGPAWAADSRQYWQWFAQVFS